MATAIAITAVGAILNATAFTGGSALFKTISGDPSSAERDRHDRALEKFTQDHNAWYEKQAEISNELKSRQTQERGAQQDLESTDYNLKLYKEQAEPVFSNYYEPSAQLKTWQYVYIISGLFAGSYIIKKYVV